ncbi:MAG: DUF6259 domain-containing protein [Verrucomicrobiota bacterium]
MKTPFRFPVLLAPLLISICCSPPTSAAALPGQSHPPPVVRDRAGDLQLTLLPLTNGVRLAGLFDLAQGQELLASNSPPLFTLTLRHAGTKKETRLSADDGWQEARIRKTRSGLEIRWARPLDKALDGLSVTATATGDAPCHAWRWKLRVDNGPSEWSVWRVIFPQIALADLGEGSAVLFPRGPGEAQKNVWNRAFKYRGNYPCGWCSMQFMAAYRVSEKPTGLYCAVHDPWGSTKDIVLESEPATRSVRMLFDHPASNMGLAGNGFDLSGTAVWQLLRGDWFDAAMIYKGWARQEARWWPRLTTDGRKDTPLWMRELNVWALGGGAPVDCVGSVQAFQKFLGVPAGFHWYNWHQIPFDNDYPHYFPAKTNFSEGVKQLKQSGVFVMPYINGRLWDSHDQGAEDFEFTRRALSAASKKDDGQPYLESYGSKETNGQPVRLAAMCPTTPLWQQTVRDTVLRLLKEVGTSAVYIDQVAAAAPTLCMDKTHGHPLGGGHWWNEGYWQMLDAIRREMPRDAMLTTECNGEPFVRWFDGYLTWHWQYDGQVPAFPAIYSGALQMFGRAYRGGATKDLALRMKAGQQLVFGEQLGWLDPGVVKEKENAEFFRHIVQLRASFNRYFAAGEMARPPRLKGDLPKVKADWQWSGEWWVTTDALQTGAWRLPKEKRMALLFVNVSDAPVTATLDCDAAQYGIHSKKLRGMITRTGENQPEAQALPSRFERQITFPARQSQAWELRW